jgi:KDO2-lipid IV(A) lauroyltransferase
MAVPTVERVLWRRRNVREAILGNTARILGLPESHVRVSETARAMLSSHSRLWIDLTRYASLDSERVRSLISRSEGTDHLLAAKAEGKGALLLTAHVGNFELGGLFLKELGIDAAAVYAPDPSPAVERHRARARAAMRVRGIPVTSSLLSFVSVLRALEENAFVAIQGDRDYSGTGIRVPFFGETASFPVGPFKIAAASGAPVLPVFVLQEPDGRYRTVVEPPIRVFEPPRRSEREEVVRAALCTFVAILEKTIRENPSQWYRFTPFWVG